ncbi:MAG: DNA primase [Oscillospiraceae bacterium]|nr:DNA primase [Oscillospiraceae bacterium]
MISDTVIEEIKFRNDIIDVVSSYVTLKRSGSNFKGLCPFHSEKTPSFTVFTTGKNFYCFGCGVGGGVIDFIMRAENLDYPAALAYLAKRAGIELKHDTDDNENNVKKSRLLEMNKAAAKFYHTQLISNETAMKYLTNRELSVALIKHFGLGFAPDDFGTLTNHLKSLGYTEKELTVGWLCGVSKKNNKPYDMFRNRIIFPIIDPAGDVIAFGGRVIDDSMPKYLNSSDTPVFKKSRNLFALNFAKNHSSENILLCEGYMDVIALHGAGFENAVATLGTSMTSDHARMLNRFTKNVIIAYDNDKAGQDAADKAFRLLGEVGMNTRIIRMTDAKDPDEYIKKYGAAKFKQIIDKSTSQFDFKLNIVLNKYDIKKDDEKISALNELIKIISEVYSEVERDIYIQRCAELFGVPGTSIKNEVGRIIRKRTVEFKKTEKQEIYKKTEGYGDRINPQSMKNMKAVRAEEAILGIILLQNEYIKSVLKNEIDLKSEYFVTDFNRKVFDAIINHYTERESFNEAILSGIFSHDEVSKIIKMKIDRTELSNNVEILKDYISALKTTKEKDIFEQLKNRERK